MTTYILRRRKLGRTSAREIARFSKTGIEHYRNDQKIPQDPDALCIRWGCTSNVPQKNILNKATAIHAVGDKRSFRGLLNEYKLCPRTWSSWAEWLGEKGNGVFPIIIRPAVHAQGKRLYVANNELYAQELCEEFEARDELYYISEFTDKVAEYRVFVCQGRAVWVAKKTPGNPHDVAWNVARGGRFDNVRFDDWPLKAVKMSIEAFNLSGLDFGGVDVMIDKNGECYVLEINSAPSQTSPYRQECVAKAFDYIVKNGKNKLPLTQAKGGYKKFIHPAIHPEAIMV